MNLLIRCLQFRIDKLYHRSHTSFDKTLRAARCHPPSSGQRYTEPPEQSTQAQGQTPLKPLNILLSAARTARMIC